MRFRRGAMWVVPAVLGLASLGLAQQVQDDTYNPLRAAKDMDVGNFYMKKGKIDAAIERYQDALIYHPNFALPHKKLGEAYEKKGDKITARKEYEKYLEILPKADDAKEIRKRIEKLWQEVETKSPPKGSR